MKTDVIRVSGKGNRFEAALKQADKVAAYKELSRKGALHLRLLTEEMMGMMRSITGEPEGDFWIEEQDGEYELHLRVKTLLSAERKEQLLAASTSGKNESAKGLMGRLREFFDYWSETNKSRTRMRYELERTWDAARRLATWASRENKFTERYGTDRKCNSTAGQREADAASIVARILAEDDGDVRK